jgi:hypothetical protein
VAVERTDRKTRIAAIQAELARVETKMTELETSFHIPKLMLTAQDPEDLAFWAPVHVVEFYRLKQRRDELSLELIDASEDVQPAAPPSPLNNADPEVLKRRAIAQQNPKKSAGDVCKLFDTAEYPVPLPGGWVEEFGVKNWVEAYKHPTLRPRIDTLISKDRRSC